MRHDISNLQTPPNDCPLSVYPEPTNAARRWFGSQEQGSGDEAVEPTIPAEGAKSWELAVMVRASKIQQMSGLRVGDDVTVMEC